jgi:hypothetical protein
MLAHDRPHEISGAGDSRLIRTAQNSVHFGRGYPSRVVLPVILRGRGSRQGRHAST